MEIKEKYAYLIELQTNEQTERRTVLHFPGSHTDSNDIEHSVVA